MRKLESVVVLVVLIVGLIVVPASAADEQGPIQNPLNGHFYEAVFIPGGIGWDAARMAAESRSLGDVDGHLVTITSAEESQFVSANFPEVVAQGEFSRFWLGGFQPQGEQEAGGGWEWVTGEVFAFTNWDTGEPNDPSATEQCLNFATGPNPTGSWNDQPCDAPGGGYLVEYDVSGAFADDEGNTFEADIDWLSETGITKGCNPPTNTLFCPSALVTRGQMAAFLVRALGYTQGGGDDLFVDDDGNIFEVDIDKLATAGVTKGCNPPINDQYCPADFVTRGQMAAFLVRALAYTDEGDGDLFTDDDGSTFEADIDKLGTAGVTKGCNPPSNTEYCPNDFVTRGQMAAFLRRALES